MATYSHEARESTAYSRVDLIQFDRSEAARGNHWRGFTKFTQPDGTVVAVSSETDAEGIALGPARDGQHADDMIGNFYAERGGR